MSDTTWTGTYAEELVKGDVFRFADESEELAHIVASPVNAYLDSWVRFSTHAERYAHIPSHQGMYEGPSILEANTVVYVRKDV